MPSMTMCAAYLYDILNLQAGLTAVIGGGGKTTLLQILGTELAQSGHTAVLCTSTKFLPFREVVTLRDPNEDLLRDVLSERKVAAVGSAVPGTKKLGPAAISFEALADLAEYVLVEADGSAGLPMKAHAPHEPVLPSGAGEVIAVVGASGFGKPILEAAHRPELYAKLAGAAPDSPITPAGEARVLDAEHLHTQVFVNQVDSPRDLIAAQALSGLLSCHVTCGALRDPARRVQFHWT